jgi:hypothetical protein
MSEKKASAVIVKVFSLLVSVLLEPRETLERLEQLERFSNSVP